MRIPSLDSVRGIAAFVVVLNHFYDVAPAFKAQTQGLMAWTPLHWLVSGRFAVVLFFVLSGFVLALPYRAGKAQAYRQYFIRRMCRIYLPFVVAVGMAAVLASIFSSPQPEWAQGETDWSFMVSPGLVASHMLMQGVGMGSISLNPPIWSLIYEIRISLFFPLLVWVALRLPLWSAGAVFGLGFVAAKLFVMMDGQANFYVGQSGAGALLLTLYYVPFFYLGAKAALCRDVIIRQLQRVPVWGHGVIFGVFFLLPARLVEAHFTVNDVYFGVFALYLIFSVQVLGAVDALLMRRAPLWLGKVSFSLYLTHLPVLLAMLYGLHGLLPEGVIVALALPVMLGVAEVFHRQVESRAQALGKRLA